MSCELRSFQRNEVLPDSGRVFRRTRFHNGKDQYDLHRLIGIREVRDDISFGSVPSRKLLMFERIVDASFAMDHEIPQLRYAALARGSPRRVSCIEFDGDRSLFAAGTTDGSVFISDINEFLLRRLCESVDRTVGPVFSIYPGLKVEAVRWNPKSENEICCAFSSGHSLFLYDLERCSPLKPTAELSSVSSGFLDCQFFPSDGFSGLSAEFCLVAGGRNGLLTFFDRRLKKPDVLYGKRLSSGTINAVQSFPGESLVVTGSSGGSFCFWDPRMQAKVVQEISLVDLYYPMPLYGVCPSHFVSLPSVETNSSLAHVSSSSARRTQPQPFRLFSNYEVNDLKRSIDCLCLSPVSSSVCGFRSSNGLFGTLDVRRGEVQGLVRPPGSMASFRGPRQRCSFTQCGLLASPVASGAMLCDPQEMGAFVLSHADMFTDHPSVCSPREYRTPGLSRTIVVNDKPVFFPCSCSGPQRIVCSELSVEHPLVRSLSNPKRQRITSETVSLPVTGRERDFEVEDVVAEVTCVAHSPVGGGIVLCGTDAGTVHVYGVPKISHIFSKEELNVREAERALRMEKKAQATAFVDRIHVERGFRSGGLEVTKSSATSSHSPPPEDFVFAEDISSDSSSDVGGDVASTNEPEDSSELFAIPSDSGVITPSGAPSDAASSALRVWSGSQLSQHVITSISNLVKGKDIPIEAATVSSLRQESPVPKTQPSLLSGSKRSSAMVVAAGGTPLPPPDIITLDGEQDSSDDQEFVDRFVAGGGV